MVKTFEVRNVHDAFLQAMDDFTWEHNVDVQESRAGRTLEFDGPVVTTYLNPCERVLFLPERDANPFFHFMEGLWMLNGEERLDFLMHYNKGMEKFSDNGKTLNGAYGYRWKRFFTKNQLDVIVKRLKADPNDRRCVLTMWDCDKDLDRETLDTPCNTHIYFKIRKGKLNMTVCCRSNDAIWGAYGANVVHFSMLQEYMAGKIGVDVGVYNQVSDSLHVYEDLFDKLKEKLPDFDFYSTKYPIVGNPYVHLKPYPMMSSPEDFDRDLELWFDGVEHGFANPFFDNVVLPIYHAWEEHKNKNTLGAIGILKAYCKADDWRNACVQWLERRQKGVSPIKDTEAVIGEINE